MLSVHERKVALGAAALLVSGAMPCRALINPNYTPADLVRAARDIVVVELTTPAGGVASVAAATGLRGSAEGWAGAVLDASADDGLRQDLEDAVGVCRTGLAFSGSFAPTPGAAEEDVHALHVGVAWFQLTRDGDRWILDRDALDLSAVWGGASPQFVSAVRYALADPMASFPVASSLSWGAPVKVGAVEGACHGALWVRVDTNRATDVVLLTEAGCRTVSAAAGTGAAPSLSPSSPAGGVVRVACAVDVDGDGVLDLLAFDGRAVGVMPGRAAGGWGALTNAAPVDGCRSLALLAPAADGTVRAVAGTASGPRVITVPAAGPVAVAPLAPSAPGGSCETADVNADGLPDVVLLTPRALHVYLAQPGGGFEAAVRTDAPPCDDRTAAAFGDYDADGVLDVVVAGRNGLAALRGVGGGAFTNVTVQSAELDYHGAQRDPKGVALAPLDANGDGRQGVFLLLADGAPIGFFNRGFLCFGMARELLVDPDGELGGAIGGGQQAGTLSDLTGDGIADLLAVGASGDLWLAPGVRQDGAPTALALSLPPAARSAVTVTLSRGGRALGMYVVRPGQPAVAGLDRKGAVTATWPSVDGPQRRDVTIMRSRSIEVR